MSRSRVAVSRTYIFIAIALVNLGAWLWPSNVLRLVARERAVLLGRYSAAHFGWCLGIAFFSILAIIVLTGSTAIARKRRLFAIAACFVFAIPMLIVTDVIIRALTVYPYQSDKVVYHRPPHFRFAGVYKDAPRVARTYPVAQPGYPDVSCNMDYDELGFRNVRVPDACDVVTVGDSFTEGQRVSNDQDWPARFEALTHLSVYNLGISGYSPAEYLASLDAYGLPRKPHVVICMLYEGNDFRSADMAPRSGLSLRAIFKTSPILMYTQSFILDTLGRVNSTGSFPGSDVLEWQPVKVPDNDKGKYYGFAPKQLIELAVDEGDFIASPAWKAVQTELLKMRDDCRKQGVRFVAAYAPNKAHVVMPLAMDHVPVDKVRAFVGLRYKGVLPQGDAFARLLLGSLDTRQAVIADWCRQEAIPFYPLTDELRAAVARGEQVYYTYDEHWSPEGHAVAARYLAAVVGTRQSAKADH